MRRSPPRRTRCWSRLRRRWRTWASTSTAAACRWTRDAGTGEYLLLADRWHTCFFDLSGEQGLLGQVEGRTADDAAYWLAQATPAWRDAVRVVAIDMCSIYASAVRRMLPGAQIAVDLFHVVHLAVKMTGDVRRRVVRGKYRRRGRAGDPEYGIKNLLVRNLEHLSPAQFVKVTGALQADAAGQEIAAAWIGKEKLRHALNLRARVTGSVPCERNVRDRLIDTEGDRKAIVTCDILLYGFQGRPAGGSTRAPDPRQELSGRWCCIASSTFPGGGRHGSGPVLVDDRDRAASHRRRCGAPGAVAQGAAAPAPIGRGDRLPAGSGGPPGRVIQRRAVGAAEAIVDMVSEDDFFGFRGWLVGQGPYQAAVADPDSLADLPELRAAEAMLPWGEEVWFVASEVHEERAGGELPPEACWTTELLGSWWPYDQHQEELRRRYPRLWARFRAEHHPKAGGEPA